MAVVVEDDNRVAYAYLIKDEQIVSDVWLYNVAPTPTNVQWEDDEATMPFLNPAKYCKPEPMPRLTSQSAVLCRWFDEAVDLFVDGIVWAHLKNGARPAWSRWALRKGPLAQPIDVEAPLQNEHS